MVTQVRSARAPQRRHVRQAATLLALILLTGCSALDLFFFEDIETRARKILAYDVGDAPPADAKPTGTQSTQAVPERDTAEKEKRLKACATSIQAERNDSTS